MYIIKFYTQQGNKIYDMTNCLKTITSVRAEDHYFFERFTLLINHVWFQLDFQLSNVAKFHILAYLKIWPLTLICDLWPCQQVKVPILHLWPKFVQMELQLLKWGKISHFQPILKFDLRWPLTLMCVLSPCQQVKVPMLHLWPKFDSN